MVHAIDPLIRHASDMVALVDGEGSTVYQGPAIERVLGFSPNELIGTIFWELVHPDDVERVARTLHDVFISGVGSSIVCQMRHANGAWHLIDAKTTRVGQGEQAYVVVNGRDITEQRRLEAALAEREAELRQAQKMEALGQLASGVAHDFRNLLTIVMGASQQLLDGLPADSPLRKQASTIRVNAERAAALTGQLLAFGRRRERAPAALDLGEVVANVEPLLKPLLGEGITLHTTLATSLWLVSADRTDLEQVLLNLATNARDAMPIGGRLTITVRNVADDERVGGPAVVMQVSDTGLGMDATTQARAFEPFFTTKAGGKGTGLGLANADRIVRQSGGRIDLSSEVGLGTTVTITLPKAESVAEPRSVTAPLPSGPEPVRHAAGGQETVLLVEDEDGVRELVQDMLELAGYRVLEANRPSAAERISRECSDVIHLLLTDVVMPEMSGVELAARLRADRPSMQVMFMSGYPAPTTGDGGGVAPGAHFLIKPFERHALLAGVREALDAAEPVRDEQPMRSA